MTAQDLRRPGGVLLVSCYELGRQPLASAWPLAFLRQAGFEPRCVDLAVERLDEEAVAQADLCAIAVPMHTALRLGVRAAERVRALRPACHIVLYGLYATLNQDHLLGEGIADACLGGEVEEALVAVAQALADGSPPPEEAADQGHAAPGVLEKLSFPPPDRRGLPGLDRYAALELDGTRRLAGAVESSRGCKHLCRHCPIPPVYRGRFFVVPRDRVQADVDALVALGAQHITFADPDFLNGPGHALAVARALHEAHPDLTFDFTAKVEHLVARPGDLTELVQLGAAFVVSAVESVSDRVLARLAKGHTRAEAEAALRLCRRVGLPLRPTFVPFTPWTTRRDLRELFAWVHDHELVDHIDPVQYSIRLLVPPGSLLEGDPSLTPHITGTDARGFRRLWRHPDPAMDALQADFAAEVEAAGRRGQDPAQTFLDLWERAGARPAGLHPPSPVRPRPPRMTEDWFC